MTTAMGDFYVFCNINNHIYVISSLGCSGLFYNLENGILYLSDSIEEIIKTKHTKINLMIWKIIDALIYGMPNPFTTIENNIKRLSPASTLIVNKSRTCKIYGYLQYNTYEQYSTPYNSKQFDESMQIIERKLREKKSNISIMYSGGIDSAALICAFKKLNIVPIIYILEKDIKKASTRYRAIRFCDR
jgi:asparagine synthetase B (glutamine-hydrolysing)